MSRASEDRGITEEKEGAAPVGVSWSRGHGRGMSDGSNAFAYLSDAVARTFVSARCPGRGRSPSVGSTSAAATIAAAAL